MKLIMATFLITCNIVIGNYRFTRANEIKVVNSWKELSDTASIKLPYLKGKITHGKENETMADFVKRGDPVTIAMGYIGYTQVYEYQEFSGFVRSVNPNIPLEIECEDATYLMRRTNIEKSWQNTTLKTIVQYLVDETNKANPDYTITLSNKIPEVKFEKFSINNTNAAAVLQEIKERYGLVAYFNDFELFVGVAFTQTNGKVKHSLAWNVVSNNLTYRREEDTMIRVKAVAILKDNKEITVTVGPSAGELVTKFFYDVSDKDTLQQLAQQELTKNRYEGFEGTIETKLIPFARHSMVTELTDPEFQKKTGSYLIDRVETTFGQNGINRSITLGVRV